jgi:glycosyltransferase involved in cell wall biosynthesis
MRVVALLATHNEERFVAQCIEHLRGQGIEVYLIDNESTDRTVAIAEDYLGKGLIGIDTLERGEHFELNLQLERKEALVEQIEADWYIHHDADEFRVSPRPGRTVHDELAEADEAGFNAVNSLDFTFIPWAEEPDHDHPRFQETMRRYYPLVPFFPHRLNAWKRQDGPVDLQTWAGHQVLFEGRKMSPRSLNMRHYMCLSAEHAAQKYVERTFPPEEVATGRHGWRARIRREQIVFPPAAEMREYHGDIWLDPANPYRGHPQVWPAL